MIELKDITIDAYTEEDSARFMELMKAPILAAYIYSENIYKCASTVGIDPGNRAVRPVLRSGEIFVPEVLFSHVVGGHVEKTRISVGEKSIDISDAVPSANAHVYLNAEENAPKLGLEARTYVGRLLILGDKESVLRFDAAVKENFRIVYAAASAVVGGIGDKTFSKADFEIAKKKWRESLVGSHELNDLTDPNIKKKIDSITAKCRSRLATINRGENIPKLWGDEPPVESRELREQYGGIFDLAMGYATFGSEFYRDEKLAETIKYAFKWMYEHMYGEAELEGRGWRSMQAFNWWDWRVGCGEIITNAMMVTDELFTYEEKKNYLKVLEFVLDNWRVGDTQNFAAGRMSLGPKTAILLEDPKRVCRAIKDYHIMLEVRLAGEGTHTDYGNYQHGFPYNMMYGLNNLHRVLKSSSVLAGTPLELVSTRYYDMFLVFKYMFEAAMYRGRGFVSFAGRNVTGSEESQGLTVAVNILPMIGNYGEEEDAYIKHFVKYSLATPELVAKAKASCSLAYMKLLNDILEDDSISAENDYESAHAWFTGDRASQHRNDYAFCVSMPSYRHPNYECINHANVTGWYMNDGALYLYTKNAQHSFDGENFIFNREVAYRIPGTTVDTRERMAVSISGGWKPPSDRVGCMQFDGKYIVAGMDYESYHVETVEEREDKGYGGPNPYHLNDLVAKKAYFMFDDECVCLGAGISSTMNADVNTIVEHRNLVKETDSEFGLDELTVDGEIMPSEYFTRRMHARYARLEDTAGYVFPDGADILVSRYGFDVTKSDTDDYTSSGWVEKNRRYEKCGKPFAEIRIEHGKNPKDATYVYAILPYADEEKIRSYSESPDFEVILNTPRCQAVREKTLGITGIIFYEAGECAGIKVDRPCIVTFSDIGGEYRIKVCEPTNKADEIRLEIGERLVPVSLDRRYTVECAERTYMTLDTSLSVGEAYEARFKFR